MMPTFAELASMDVLKPIAGISIVPTLLGRSGQKRHEYLYWGLGTNRAARMGYWKAVQIGGAKNPDNPVELYNLKDDIGETTDLAASHPQLAEKMLDIIKASHKDSPWYTWEYDGPRPPKT